MTASTNPSTTKLSDRIISREAAAMLQDLARQLRRAAEDPAVSFAEYMAIRNAYLKRMEENQCEQK